MTQIKLKNKQIIIVSSFFRHLLFLSLFLIATSGKAESNPDSLLNIYNDHQRSWQNRLEALNSFCYEIVFNDPDSALPYIREAISLSEINELKKQKAKADYNLSVYHLFTGDMDSSIYYAHECILINRKTQDQFSEAEAMNLLANIIADNEPDSALFYYKKSVDIYKAIGQEENIAGNYINMALTYQMQGNYPMAMDLTNKALNYLQKWKNSTWETNAYAILGNVFHSLKDYSKAIEYYEKGLKIIEENNNLRGMFTSYINLSSIYLEIGQFEQVRYCLNKVKEVSQQMNFILGMAAYHENLAILFQKNDQIDSARNHANEAFQIYTQVNRQDKISNILGILGEIEIQSNNFALAVQYCSQGYQIALYLRKDNALLSTCNCLYKSYKALDHADSALKYIELYTGFKDSSINLENTKQLTQKEMQFQFDLKQINDSIQLAEEKRIKEIEYQKNLSKKERSRLFLLAALIIAILIVIFIIRENLKRKKQSDLLNQKNEQINLALHEKELLLKEVHHRVKNNFQTISSLLDLQAKGVFDEQALISINEGQSRIKAMALIHQKLYQNDDISTIDLEEYISLLTQQIMASYSLDQINIEISTDQIELDIDTAIPLGLILNELITNACKYAFQQKETGHLQVICKQIDPWQYLLVVKDSGEGLPENIDLTKTKSLGLRLVSRLTKQLHGELIYSNEHGSKFEIKFKNTSGRREVE